MIGHLYIKGITHVVIGIAMSLATLCLSVVAFADPPSGTARKCEDNPCLIIEYEPALADEASSLVNILNVRMAKYDLVVRLDVKNDFPNAPRRDIQDSLHQWLWIVHLRKLSGELMLVAVDNLAGISEDDVVREIHKGENAEDTAWTTALIIEEAVAPYLKDTTNRAALGAGLAIIEPQVVSGVKKAPLQDKPHYPKIKSVGLGVVSYWIFSEQNLVIGPQISIEGSFSENITASLELSWVSWSDFSEGEITGQMSLLPIDILLGYVLWSSRVVELATTMGFSVGFSIYKTDNAIRQRTDILFEPMILGLLRGSFKIHKLWRIYISSGAVIPLVRDELSNEGVEIYCQSWILPRFNLGISLKF